MATTSPLSRPWRVARITPMGELLQPGRITGTVARLAVQVFLVVVLWRSLYAGVESSAGLARDQAVTYAVLAVLCLQMRGLYRAIAWDSVFQHVQEGSIVYWFLRPVTPRRYYLIRAVGDLAYGFVWVVAGYTICLATGLVAPPPSAAAALAAAVSLLFGQLTMYYLMLVVDLLCFWTIKNNSAVQIIDFAQNLLSGAFAPLWYFPGWFIALSAVLPFQGTMHVPLSLYIGRIPAERAPLEIAVQASWCLVLAVITGVMWRRVSARLTVQGG
jgi:viologen exporter family transport system permease protein